MNHTNITKEWTRERSIADFLEITTDTFRQKVKNKQYKIGGKPKRIGNVKYYQTKEVDKFIVELFKEPIKRPDRKGKKIGRE